MDAKKYISVHTLNKYIKERFDQDASLHNVYITGEISNYRPHPSGHLYFTLKDDHSRISAVMFSSAAKKLQFQLENGMKVYIRARVSVYEVTGEYQLYVQSIEQDGLGKLYLAFEDLKKKEDKVITDGNYVELNEVFQQGYAFGLLLMLRDNHHIKSIINITKEDAKEILSTFDVEQVNAMSNLCNELSNKNNSLKNMKKEYK